MNADMNGILIIAHAPLASALRECVLHVFPDCASGVQAVDVQPDEAPETSLQRAQQALRQFGVDPVLLLSDVFGATPCNVAQKLSDDVTTRLVTGVNLPMLLRTVCYRHESLDALVSRAQTGGVQGIMPVGCTAAPNPIGHSSHAPGHHDHQQ